MTGHSPLLEPYQRFREVRFRLNNLLVKTLSKRVLEEAGRTLGFFQRGKLYFDTEDETAVLMDYCLYNSNPEGRNTIAKYLEKSPPPAGSDELVALQQMTHAYYSLLQVVDVERGVGVSVRDLFRDETGFLVDVGFGTTARPHQMLASRIIPADDFIMTGGAALPVSEPALVRIFKELERTGYSPETFDFTQISPVQEAEMAALVIRTCRATGMSTRIHYEEPGNSAGVAHRESRPRRPGRNEPCLCGSGKKFKMCCGRNLR